jgi:hypothetical protein
MDVYDLDRGLYMDGDLLFATVCEGIFFAVVAEVGRKRCRSSQLPNVEILPLQTRRVMDGCNAL